MYSDIPIIAVEWSGTPKETYVVLTRPKIISHYGIVISTNHPNQK